MARAIRSAYDNEPHAFFRVLRKEEQGRIHGYPSRVRGGQGPYLMLVEHLGRGSIAKNPINAKKVKCNGRTAGPIKRGVESRRTRPKMVVRFTSGDAWEKSSLA